MSTALLLAHNLNSEPTTPAVRLDAMPFLTDGKLLMGMKDPKSGGAYADW